MFDALAARYHPLGRLEDVSASKYLRSLVVMDFSPIEALSADLLLFLES
jgi:hypothetical protein